MRIIRYSTSAWMGAGWCIAKENKKSKKMSWRKMPAVIIYESCVRYESDLIWPHTAAGQRQYQRCTVRNLDKWTVMQPWKFKRISEKRTVNGTRKLSGLVRNQTSYAEQEMKWTHEVLEVSAEQKLSILILRRRIKIFYREFDPGSGWTLAACLTHASRTGMPFLKRLAC